jgi:acyl-CoA synthetase (AMP-forming)/AMP-acid ligase II
VRTIPEVLADRTSDKPFLICDDEVLTYAEADRRSAALAKGLLADGIGAGSHVGLLHPNGADFVVRWLAAARIGAVTVPLSTFSTAPELHALVRGADVELLLSARSFRGRDLPVPEPGLDLPLLRRVAFDDLEGDGDLDAVKVLPSDRMVIVHTSGSTSAPKGVIHQHGPLIAHLEGLNRLRRYTEDDVLFSPSPFFWIGGFAYSLLGTLLAGATLVVSNATDASATLDLLERTRPTMVNGFAAGVAHLAKDPSFPSRDLSSIRRGNLWPILPNPPADPELRHNMLGMTEAGSVCLASDDEGDQPEHRRGSFGKVVPGLEGTLVDGELWLRGPSMMEGYYGRERHEVFTPDGWYRTGDLFREDDDGFLYFLGRAGDMIKVAGANVSPREVEAAILDETGLVAHVLGLDDADRGQVVAAAIRGEVDVDELRAKLRARLSAYKVPTRWLCLADAKVPMLSSGKLDSKALQERFR